MGPSSASRNVGAALLALAGAPVGALALAVRPTWRIGLSERLGGGPGPAPGAGHPVWIHAASAGEVLAAGPLIERWRAAGRPLYASATSVTGRELLRERWPDLPSALAPLDHPYCVDRALARVAPRALVLIETELWPCWIAAARRRGIPVIVASARLSERSFRRYRSLGGLWRPTFERLAGVAAASPDDAHRFVALGAPPTRVDVTGDLKLDLPEAPARPPDDVARVLPGGPVLVAGSTHPGEERAVADALDRVEAEGFALPAVIAPRRLERLDSVERELVARGRVVRRRSRLGTAPLAPGEILLLDGMGELASIYGAGDFAFLGGTLAAVGGHNLVEPIAAGHPVLHGPHIERSRHVVGLLRETGACCEVADARELGASLLRWLRDPGAARRAGIRGRSALERAGGSVRRTAEMVEAVWGDGVLPPEAESAGGADGAAGGASW